MPSLNRVQLIGRLGKDPETRFTPTGKKVTSFRMAVDEAWKDGEGNQQKHTEWFNVNAWGRLGEICQEYLHKGSLVYLEGRFQTEVVGEGESRKYYTKVVANLMKMLDRRTAEEEAIPEQPGEDEEFPF